MILEWKEEKFRDEEFFLFFYFVGGWDTKTHTRNLWANCLSLSLLLLHKQYIMQVLVKEVTNFEEMHRPTASAELWVCNRWKINSRHFFISFAVAAHTSYDFFCCLPARSCNTINYFTQFLILLILLAS